MSLLTKDQQPFDTLRQILYRYRGQIDVNDESKMLAIIDDLQARAPKQYTEQELVMIFQKDYPKYWQGISGDYFQRGFREALRRVGALKAEP